MDTASTSNASQDGKVPPPGLFVIREGRDYNEFSRRLIFTVLDNLILPRDLSKDGGKLIRIC